MFHPLSDTPFEFLNGIWSEIQPSDRKGIFRKSSFEFLKQLATALNANASPSRKESVHKIAIQEIEGFTHLLKMYNTCVTDADLSEEEILDTLTLLSCYLHRFWIRLVRHIFPATKLIAQNYPQIITKLPEKLQYIYMILIDFHRILSTFRKYHPKLSKNYPLTTRILKLKIIMQKHIHLPVPIL